MRAEGSSEAAISQPGFGAGVMLQVGFPEGGRTLLDEFVEYCITDTASAPTWGTSKNYTSRGTR